MAGRNFFETRLKQVCDAEMVALLEAVSRAAEALDVQAYLVGGVVRDVLLGISSVDLDIMLETDAGAFTKQLRNDWQRWFARWPEPRKPQIFKHYGTAKLHFPKPLSCGASGLDFSTARAERYPVPGGKPLIERGDLAADLARRDFSCNALAVSLSGRAFGSLIDQHHGVRDIEQRRIRVLHELSFVEDPARLIRALRFAARFSFQLEAQTEHLFIKAVADRLLDTLPRQRLFDEFKKALMEDAAGVLPLLADRGLLAQILPGTTVSTSIEREFQKLRQLPENASQEIWKLRLALLLATVPEAKRQSCLRQFGLPDLLIAELNQLAAA